MIRKYFYFMLTVYLLSFSPYFPNQPIIIYSNSKSYMATITPIYEGGKRRFIIDILEIYNGKYKTKNDSIRIDYMYNFYILTNDGAYLIGLDEKYKRQNKFMMIYDINKKYISYINYKDIFSLYDQITHYTLNSIDRSIMQVIGNTILFALSEPSECQSNILNCSAVIEYGNKIVIFTDSGRLTEINIRTMKIRKGISVKDYYNLLVNYASKNISSLNTKEKMAAIKVIANLRICSYYDQLLYMSKNDEYKNTKINIRTNKVSYEYPIREEAKLALKKLRNCQ